MLLGVSTSLISAKDPIHELVKNSYRHLPPKRQIAIATRHKISTEGRSRIYCISSKTAAHACKEAGIRGPDLISLAT
jgi:hypothetical protein